MRFPHWTTVSLRWKLVLGSALIEIVMLSVLIASNVRLIETSLQLGFVPILASVKPQISAHVAIDLEGGNSPTGIYIDEADWKYIRPRTQSPRSNLQRTTSEESA